MPLLTTLLTSNLWDFHTKHFSYLLLRSSEKAMAPHSSTLA